MGKISNTPPPLTFPSALFPRIDIDLCQLPEISLLCGRARSFLSELSRACSHKEFHSPTCFFLFFSDYFGESDTRDYAVHQGIGKTVRYAFNEKAPRNTIAAEIHQSNDLVRLDLPMIRSSTTTIPCFKTKKTPHLSASKTPKGGLRCCNCEDLIFCQFLSNNAYKFYNRR